MVKDKIQEIYENQIVERSNKLQDKLYDVLKKVPEFRNLSLDRQGEIILNIISDMGY